jgi:hypothetical protein
LLLKFQQSLGLFMMSQSKLVSFCNLHWLWRTVILYPCLFVYSGRWNSRLQWNICWYSIDLFASLLHVYDFQILFADMVVASCSRATSYRNILFRNSSNQPQWGMCLPMWSLWSKMTKIDSFCFTEFIWCMRWPFCRLTLSSPS